MHTRYILLTTQWMGGAIYTYFFKFILNMQSKHCLGWT